MAASIELEGVNERIGELVRQRDEARIDARNAAHRFLTRNVVRDPIGLESSLRLQRMEMTIESIASG